MDAAATSERLTGPRSRCVAPKGGRPLTLLGNWGPCPGSPCIRDVNVDGTVDQTDLQQVLGNLGPCDGCPEDVTGDGVVNGQDAAAVAAHFGPCP